MPDQLQLRGGTTTEHNSFTGVAREVTVDTTKKTLVVHDNSTTGGTPLMKESGSNHAATVSIGTGGNDVINIDNSQKVGINDSSPSHTLDITGASGGNGEVHVKRTSGASCFIQAQSQSAVFGSFSDHMCQLKSKNLTALTIDTSQNIGIGTTNPDALLHVNSGTVNTCATFESSDAGAVINIKDNSARSSIEQSGTDLKIISDTDGGDPNSTIKLQVDQSTKMTIDSSGNIGAPSGTNIHNASDSRLKKNVVDIDKGLSAIKSLRPVSFNWIDGFCDAEKDTLYGFIAQEVQSVDSKLIQNFSEEIMVDGNKIENVLRVNEKFIIPMLVKAVQELSAKVEALEAA